MKHGRYFWILAGLLPALPGAAQERDSRQAEQAIGATVEEVMVTARRREERLRDVPIAASAITDAMIGALVLDSVDDYLRQVPSATLVTSGPEYLNDITIRGQGSGRLGFSETATGLFRDGMYSAGGGFGGRSLSRMDTFDIDRIEVLRGPQGALFGRNSVGGAINVVSKRSSEEFALRGTVRAASNDRRDAEGIVNVPLGSRAGLRLGGIWQEQDEGFIRNETTDHYLDTQRYRGLRSVFDMGASDSLRVGAFYEYYDALAPAFVNLGQRPLRIDGTTLDPQPYVRSDMNREGGSDIRQHYAMIDAQYSMSAATLTAKVNFTQRDGGRSNEDYDHYGGQSGIDVAPGADVLSADYTLAQHEDYERIGAQAYLASSTAGSVSWLAGIEGLWSGSDVVVDPDLCLPYTGAALPDAPGCFIGRPGVLSPVGAAVRNAGRIGLTHDEFSEDITSYSLFGSVDWKLSDRFKLGGELRVQDDRKEFDFLRYSEDPLVYFGSGAAPAGLLPPLMIDPDGGGPRAASFVEFCPPDLVAGQCLAGLESARIQARRDWTFWTPAVTLHYATSDDHAFYARFATGDRPGGFNTNLAPTTVREDLAASLIYEPEKADSFELGWKGAWLDGALEGEAAVFYIETRDVQVVSVPSLQGRGFVLQNAGDAYVYGGELELRHAARLGRGRLISSLALSSQEGEFEAGASVLLDTNGDGVPDQLDLSGNDVPRLRDYQLALNMAYSLPLTASLSGSAGVSLQTAAGGYENPDNSREYSDYTLLDARLGVLGQHWKVSLYGRNLTDEVYLLNAVGANNFWSDGRTYGVEVTLKY